MTRYFVLNYELNGNLSSSNLDNIAAVTESETGGFGIGLSIEKSITESHKGKIYAKSPYGYSVSFTAEL